MQRVTIASRFCGPPDSANGGWACGAVARFVGDEAEVTLRCPPPLEVEMSVVETPDGLELRAGDTLVAEARAASHAIEPPEPVSIDEATEAAKRFAWRDSHPYPTCFVCGPGRGPDGLRLFAGAVEGRRVAAAPWIVAADLCEDGTARPELLWSALDCPSWFGYRAFHDDPGLILLGRLGAVLRRRPQPNERCVVAGWPVSRDGRKIRCGSVVWSADGEVLALGSATWIALRSAEPVV
jgi:hypothetical protein